MTAGWFTSMAPAPTPVSPTPPSVSLVNVEVFLQVTKLIGSQSFHIHLSNFSKSTSTCKANLVKDSVDLSNIPSEYHKFTDVFSESRANTLALHQPYDLKIHLDKGMSPLWGPIYFLSQSKLQVLCDFIEENLHTGFIQPSWSLHKAPVLFVWKKDDSLRLCVDYRGLNKISRKDEYLLPLLTDFLDASRKA